MTEFEEDLYYNKNLVTFYIPTEPKKKFIPRLIFTERNIFLEKKPKTKKLKKKVRIEKNRFIKNENPIDIDLFYKKHQFNSYVYRTDKYKFPKSMFLISSSRFNCLLYSRNCYKLSGYYYQIRVNNRGFILNRNCKTSIIKLYHEIVLRKPDIKEKYGLKYLKGEIKFPYHSNNEHNIKRNYKDLRINYKSWKSYPYEYIKGNSLHEKLSSSELGYKPKMANPPKQIQRLKFPFYFYKKPFIKEYRFLSMLNQKKELFYNEILPYPLIFSKIPLPYWSYLQHWVSDLVLRNMLLTKDPLYNRSIFSSFSRRSINNQYTKNVQNKLFFYKKPIKSDFKGLYKKQFPYYF